MPEIWITGIGVASPLGIGAEAVRASLAGGSNGLGPLTLFDRGDLPIHRVGEVKDFRPREMVVNKKSLKVSKRNCHLAMAAGRLAWTDAGLDEGVPASRAGVVMSAGRTTAIVEELAHAVRDSFSPDGRLDYSLYAENSTVYLPPYWFLRYIPNMVPAHTAIELNFKGPSNTLCAGVVGGLLALEEACSILERGEAEVMLAGGSDSFVEPYHWITLRQLGLLDERPERSPSPFEPDAAGTVLGEAAALLVLETESSAKKRGRDPIAIVGGFESGRLPRRKEDGKPGLPRIPSETKPAALTALMGSGVPERDALETELAADSNWLCYRNRTGWLGGTQGPHDLACLLLEASSKGGVVTATPDLTDPIGGRAKWVENRVRSGDRLRVQSLSRSGRFSAVTVRLP